ncbi:PHD finger domain protein [Paecilomyces variotii No. 5]|uniref:PHD finger domain protein n=1 Tax=Byssochlamys spectabilis (strain No. 5 / NBRC 109023) TaxID=1356009 RepID=V5HTS0_BYSSN|nr:PHD finger domain protein [Paecilomyces variotii No. 5]
MRPRCQSHRPRVMRQNEYLVEDGGPFRNSLLSSGAREQLEASSRFPGCLNLIMLRSNFLGFAVPQRPPGHGDQPPVKRRRPDDNATPSSSTADLSSEPRDVSTLSFTSGLMPGREQSQVYTDWIKAGKPHNFICHECRKPNNLLLCKTCCRGYHASCLPASPVPENLEDFHCPSCKEKHWDTSPPRILPSAPPSDISRSVSPSITEAERRTASMNHIHSEHGSPATRVSTPQLQFPADVGDLWPNPTIPFRPNIDPAARAKDFLAEYDGHHANREYGSDFLLQLGRMIQQAESSSQSLREAESLREENAKLKRENSQLRLNLSSRLSSRDPALSLRRSPSATRTYTSSNNSVASLIPPDVSERSWDRIISDVF